MSRSLVLSILAISSLSLVAVSSPGCVGGGDELDDHACSHIDDSGIAVQAVADLSDAVDVPLEVIEHAVWKVSLLAGTSYVKIEVTEAGPARLFLNEGSVLDGLVSEDGTELELEEPHKSPLCPQDVVDIRAMHLEAGVSFLRFETGEAYDQWLLLFPDEAHDDHEH